MNLMSFFSILQSTLLDVVPIAAVLFGFQFFVLRRRVRHLRQVLFGFILVILGLAFFLLGLEQALFPLGKMMAQQLTAPDFLGLLEGGDLDWGDYYWVYLFAAAIGFSTAIAEPSLLAVAIKAQQVSGGAIQANGLRVAVALGASFGIALGAFRIVSGLPLYSFILAGYIIVIIQTYYCPKSIVGLAYDSGGVTTSTVTVPLVAALGLGLATNIPGRNPMLDGFGMIAIACLFPIVAVMAYAQFGDWYARRLDRNTTHR